MNYYTELCRSLADVLLQASWQAAMLAVVILLAQRLLRRWLTPTWRHALWLILVARLLLPLALVSAWSLFNLTPDWRGLTAARRTGLSSPPRMTSSGAPPGGVQASTPAPAAAPDPRGTAATRGHSRWPAIATSDSHPMGEPARGAITVPPDPFSRGVVPGTAAPVANSSPPVWPWLVVVVWTSGILVLSMRLLRSWLRFRRELRSARLLNDVPWGDLLSECRERLRVRRSLRLCAVDWVHSPALCGWWRPRLLLPAGLAERLSHDELRHVLLHELAHLKRYDILVNWIATAAQVLHWFNPVVWLAMRRLRAERELAADHLALVALGENGARAYGETILSLMAGVGRPEVVPAMVGILEDQRALRERITAVATFRRPGRWSASAAALVALLAVVGLTNAREGDPGTLSGSGRAKTPAEASDLPVEPRQSPEDSIWGTITINSQPLTNTAVRLHYRHQREGVDAAIGAQGVLRIPRALQENLCVISCAEGVTDVIPETLADGFHYELQPVGRIEGRLLFGEAPAANVRVALTAVPLGAQRTHSELLETLTDPNGRFTFATVPPGRWRLHRYIDLPDNPAWKATRRKDGPTAGSSWIGGLESIVEVQARTTNRLELGRKTRTLTGRVVAAGTPVDFDWNTFHFGLSLPWFPDTNTSAGREWARLIESEHQQTGGQRREYRPEFEPDGRFIVHGVVPGNYALSLAFRGAPAAGPAVDMQTVATAGGLVTVPSIDDGAAEPPYDIGAFKLRPVRRLRVGDSGLAFQGTDATGGTLRFSPVGRTPALLYFWPGDNHFALNALKRVIDGAGGGGSLRVLVLVAAPDFGEAKRHWTYADTGWPLVQLADELAVKEAYEVEAFPALILLDAEGKVVARHWEAEALAPFLRTLAGNTEAPGAPAAPASEADRLWGTVHLDGQPLEGAWVTYHDRGRAMGGSGRTDAQGRIALYANPRARWLVVWHDPLQAVVDARTLSPEFRVDLGTARASITGTLWRGDQPWPGKELTLQRRWPGLVEPSYSPVNRTNQAVRIPATTDAQGRFQFAEVPCGVWVVRSRDIAWCEFPVRPGEASNYELGRLGAAIVGQVVTTDPSWTPDWRNADVNLMTNVRGLQRWLPGELEADGSFVVPEVPAGDHELIIVLKSTRVIRQNQFPVELGATPRTPVSVPEATSTDPHPRVIRVGTLQMRKHRTAGSPSSRVIDLGTLPGALGSNLDI